MDMSKPNEKNNQSALTACFEWLSMLISALIVVTIVFMLFFRVVSVSGNSMCNTLYNGDRLVLVTQFYSIERGDIVVVGHDENGPLIKRVIGIAGDTIRIDEENGRVIRNGTWLDEDYVPDGYTPTMDFIDAYTVKQGEVFVMGDNRIDSLDSRQLGAFSTDLVIGEVVFRLFPLKSIGRI